uniref:Uncharacterized protein n=1 Tax=Arundo donax TaxID=35708 RepID=A0A0A8XPZ6_ARUDO
MYQQKFCSILICYGQLQFLFKISVCSHKCILYAKVWSSILEEIIFSHSKVFVPLSPCYHFPHLLKDLRDTHLNIPKSTSASALLFYSWFYFEMYTLHSFYSFALLPLPS